MNFLAKTLTSFTSYNVPYNFGTKIQDGVAQDYSSSSIWTVYEGTSKADGSNCTIFEIDLREHKNSSYVPLAKNAAKKLKSTRIPGVLKVLETLETDSNIYIFSEPVTPLWKYLQDNKPLSNEALMFGIYVISQTLKHLNVEGGSVHGSVDLSTIFVSESGEWRLGGFELLTNVKLDTDPALFRYSAASPVFNNVLPPEVDARGLQSLENSNHVFKLDSYKLGALIWCLFNHVTSSRELNGQQQKLVHIAKIPKHVQPVYKKLVQNSVTARITIDVMLKQGQQMFSSNKLISCYDELNEINLKSNSEKLEFIKSLESIKQISPPGFMEYKILPTLVQMFNISTQTTNGMSVDSNYAATCLYYILSLSENLGENEFRKHVTPTVIQAFHVPDRTIRVTLLTSLPKFVEKLNKSEVSDKIFSNLLTGFSDTNSTIREETLKAMLPLSEKITERQLNNELLRYLAKLQNDDVATIRTNTVICLCKIAKHLNNNSRPGVLITAFNKSLKDKFAPARVAGLSAFETSLEYFSPDLCCSRVLSCVAPCLLDKNSKVRTQARHVFDLYMNKIEKEAENMPATEDELEKSETSNTGESKPNISSFGYSLAVGAFSKLSGLGGNMEADTEPVNISRVGTPVSAMSAGSVVSEPIAAKSGKSWGAFDDLEDAVDDEDGGWGADPVDELDDTWGVEERVERIHIGKKPVKTERVSSFGNSFNKPKPTASASTGASSGATGSSTASSSKGLKLGKKKLGSKITTSGAKTNAKSSLNLKFEDTEDGWGDGW